MEETKSEHIYEEIIDESQVTVIHKPPVRPLRVQQLPGLRAIMENLEEADSNAGLPKRVLSIIAPGVSRYTQTPVRSPTVIHYNPQIQCTVYNIVKRALPLRNFARDTSGTQTDPEVVSLMPGRQELKKEDETKAEAASGEVLI